MKNINALYSDGTYISGFKAKWRARPTDWPSFDVDDHLITFGSKDLDTNSLSNGLGNEDFKKVQFCFQETDTDTEQVFKGI